MAIQESSELVSSRENCVQQLDPNHEIFKTCDRAKPSNPHNYTELELARRRIEINQMERDHPTLPPKWLEWTYDWIGHLSEEERLEVLAGKYNEPIKKLDYCGTRKSVEFTGKWEITRGPDGELDPELPYTIIP